jgi:hypothetical protein
MLTASICIISCILNRSMLSIHSFELNRDIDPMTDIIIPSATIKSQRSHKTVGLKVFFYYFCLIIEGSGAGSVPSTLSWIRIQEAQKHPDPQHWLFLFKLVFFHRLPPFSYHQCTYRIFPLTIMWHIAFVVSLFFS